jgi:hypothetical protein
VLTCRVLPDPVSIRPVSIRPALTCAGPIAASESTGQRAADDIDRDAYGGRRRKAGRRIESHAHELSFAAARHGCTGDRRVHARGRLTLIVAAGERPSAVSCGIGHAHLLSHHLNGSEAKREHEQDGGN